MTAREPGAVPAFDSKLSRRRMLAARSCVTGGLCWGPGLDAAGARSGRPSDDEFLDELERATALLVFWENGDPTTGLVKDRSTVDRPDAREIASIAATGFGLTALCIADKRRYFDRVKIRERVHTTLRSTSASPC